MNSNLRAKYDKLKKDGELKVDERECLSKVQGRKITFNDLFNCHCKGNTKCSIPMFTAASTLNSNYKTYTY